MATGPQLGSDCISQATVAHSGSVVVTKRQRWPNSCRDGCSEGSGCHSGGRIRVVVAASEAEMAALRQWWSHPCSGGRKRGRDGRIEAVVAASKAIVAQ